MSANDSASSAGPEWRPPVLKGGGAPEPTPIRVVPPPRPGSIPTRLTEPAPPPRATGAPRRVPLLVALFFLSGATALVYEVVWARALGLALGTSAVATATVLAAFMAGLGAGAWTAEEMGDRVKRPLKAYGILELAVAALAFALPWAFDALATAPKVVAGAAAGIALVVPAAARGATFPRACRAGGASPAVLYGSNTLGAVAGTLAAAFVLLPSIGMSATGRLAAVASAAVGLAAILADYLAAQAEIQPITIRRSGRMGATPPPSGEVPAAAPAEGGPFAPAPAALLWAAFLSGFAGLALEVVYARVLSLVMGGTVYALATILATFLAGIALGSLWAARPGRPAASLAPIALAGTAAAALATLHAVPELPYLYVRLYQRLGPSPTLEAALAALVLLAPALGLGASFALLLGAARDPLRPGRLYGANTAGAIVGALGGGLVLVPAIGLPATGGAAAAASARGAGLVARRRGQALAAAAVLLVAGVVAAPGWNRSLLATGAYAYVATLPAGISRELFLSQFAPGKIDLRYARDGRTSTVTVERFPHVNTVYLKNNGKVDGSAPIDPARPSAADMSTQRALAAAPIALRMAAGTRGPARNVLVIGLGGGVTAGAALGFPEVERLDVVEIEPEVARAVRATGDFEAASGRPLDDPRCRLHTGDARRFLALAPEGAYDAIASQPAEPWLTGTANLFTREFFALGRRALKPEGLFCQWLQLYGLDRDGLATLLATFKSAFPEVLVLRPRGARELLLVGSARPFRIDANAPEWKGTPAGDLLGEIAAATPEVDRLAAGAPENGDDDGRIEFLAARTRFVESAEAERLAAHLRFAPAVPDEGTQASGGFAHVFAFVPPQRAVELAEEASRAGNFGTAESWLRLLGDTAEMRRRLGDLALRRGDRAGALVEWCEALRRDPADRAALERVARLRATIEAGGP